MTKSHLFLGAAAFAVAISVSQPAFAQETAAEAECVDENNNGVCDSDETAGRAIVVTGSRIARPTLDSPTPLTSVTVGELTDDGSISLGDALNDLPSLRSTFSSGNSSRFIGTAGLNFLDLRGLGTTRTLVLVNGKRHITASAGDYRIDVNTIPFDLLERVDIVTGGNSAVYGSDAVAGVVNFILKRDFEGLEFDAQAGISQRGDRGTYSTSLTWGRNFADGRGNVAVSGEYSRQEPLYLRDRDELTGAFSGRCQYQTTEVTTGEPAAGDGISDTTFLCGIRNASISDGGTVGGLGGGRFLRFDNNGNIFTDVPTQDFGAFGSGFQQGGDGSTLNGVGSMLAAVDRVTVNLLAHFDVSDAFRPYVEAKYVRVDVSGEGQASFFSGGPNIQYNNGRVAGPAMRCDNGFLNAQALAGLRAVGLCANTATGTIPLTRYNTDFGGRKFDGVRETYRAVVGVEGDFNEDWRYELFANYGKFESLGLNQSNLLLYSRDGLSRDGFNLAVDAMIAPTTFSGTNFVTNSTGQRVICRINATTNVNPGCVPVNVFGSNAQDPRALDFILEDGVSRESAEQVNIGGFVSGDLSQLFELPGGPIAFVLGAEYRSESSSIDHDDLVSSGATFLNALQDFNPPKLTIKEAYGEIQIPLLKDMPFAEELTISAAGRVSDYNTAVGTVYAYNIQGIYAPIPDIRLRASYATSVRAPTQGDLFSTPGENFAQIADPCDSININGGPNRRANCAAGGVPTTLNAAAVAACASSAVPAPDRELGDPWRNCPGVTSSTGFLSGGNPTLIEERGKSLTLGAVFEPSFLPGLNFTVDYYNIEVKNLIAALTAQTIINNCYDSPGGIGNAFCTTVRRDAATGFFSPPAVISGGINFARQKAEGIDFDLAYRKTFENGHRVSLRAIATRVLRFDNYLDPAIPTDPNRQLSELGDPKWSANLNASYDFGVVRVGYGLRYIGKQTILTYETQNSYRTICPTSGVTPNTGGALNGAAVPCTAGALVRVAPNNADARPRIYYPDAFYHSFRVDMQVNTKFNFYMGVDNAFDRQPPLGLLGTAGGDPYDTFGRYFFAGIRAEF